MPEHSGYPLDKDEVVRNLRDAPGQPLIGERSLATSPAPELTIVIPTFNERDNIPVITERLRTLLAAVSWEIIFVDDDSPDGSAALTKELGAHDQRIRCIRRLGRRGLAGACIEGMLASQATFVAVMDADLQHDETLLLRMLELLRGNEAEMVIGSRYIEQGTAEALPRWRRLGSRFAASFTSRLLGIDIADPTSGFFMMRRDAFETIAPRLSTQGFKILADILASSDRALRVRELPFRFGTRLHGSSKLDTHVVLDFLNLVLAKSTHNIVPLRFVSFGVVGTVGIFVHLLVLKGTLMTSAGFPLAQSVATFVSMTSNFLLNNLFTYRDCRLAGLSAVRGLAIFYLICSIGALSNIGVASWLYANQRIWWLDGLLGSIVGAVWNFTLSNRLVWRA